MIQLLRAPKPIYNRQERIQDRQGTESDLFFLKAYAIFFLLFFFTMAIGVKLTRAEEIDPLVTLHEEICATVANSPLCKDFELLRRLSTISEAKGVPTRLIVGIMYAESSLATNYNKPICKTRNNPYGIKGRKFDNGKVEWFSGNGKADKDGCWLYPFKSLEEATESLVNTISMGYKTCENDITCISYSYVGKHDISEASWVGRVSTFL